MKTSTNRITIFSFLMAMMLMLGYSCKDKPQTSKAEPKAVTKTVEKLSPVYQEIASFMGMEATDSTQIETLMDFKVLTETDSLTGSNAIENLKIYKNITKKGG